MPSKELSLLAFVQFMHCFSYYFAVYCKSPEEST